MKRLRWQLLVVLLALAAIGVLLLGQQPVLLSGSPVAEVEPTSGGVYTEALIGAFGRLNPLLDANNQADRDLNHLIFSGLVRFDARGVPIGDLAETWGISQDGSVYNFSIQPEATWHDGQAVTSTDIIFTIDMMRSEDIPLPADLRDFWNQIEVIELDEKTLQFRLPEPFAPFMDYLSFGVLPAHLLSDLAPADLLEADFNLNPVGSGPFRFQQLMVENGQIQGVVLQKNPDFYGEAPFIEQLVFRYYPDSVAALQAYQANEVQGISRITTETLPDALRLPELNLYTGRLSMLTLIYLNLDNPDVIALQDPVVREALMMGLNRQWMIDHVLGGQAIPANGPIFPDTWAYYDGQTQFQYNAEQALHLLKEAEYTVPASGGTARAKEGAALAFTLLYPEGEPYAALAEAIQRDWQKLGVELTLTPMPYADLITNHLETRDYELALVDLDFTQSPDPDPYPFWHQAEAKNGQNYSQWDDRQASEYLEQARVQVDSAERLKRYRNFQVRFSAELPSLPLFYPVFTYAVDSQVQGVRMGALFELSERFNTITAWFLQSRRPDSAAPASTATP